MSGSGGLGCVIVAVEGSEESMNALRWALENLQLRSPAPDSSSNSGGHFVILYVQSPPNIATGLNPGAIPFGGPTPSDVEVPAFTAAIVAHQRRISEAILTHALQICSDKSVKNVKTQVMVGDAKEKLCEAVKVLHADLLVMGSRAFGPIKRMFLGSVSNYCTNNATCAVTIVKGTSRQAIRG
ncbi:universal stress protein PHOS34 isoform X2 [Rhododendron vialii]|uniref:universal stress protein PHOS34 isoform X2 n=1 Tax=Rhododendron vialii TaxID=182163 RepID=UPI00265FF7A0|nr:universal stress protein PHOS34 isoform X2 [Rhododendron vialii]